MVQNILPGALGPLASLAIFAVEIRMDRDKYLDP